MKKKFVIILLAVSFVFNIIFLINLYNNKSTTALEEGTFQTSTFYIDESISPIYTIILHDSDFVLYTGDNKIKLTGKYILENEFIYVSIDDNQLVGHILSNKTFLFPIQYDNNVFVLNFNKVGDYPMYTE